MQPGDIPKIHANISNLENEINYNPSTSVEEGISKFIDWPLDFYGKNISAN